ncbi:unnamed protein product [Fusarium fujikuroi]|nr:hypothetical protein CEK25_003703 [Fusarium fujikuroi]VZH99170.1 unnamed protein product [Fusarium fujikuroi]
MIFHHSPSQSSITDDHIPPRVPLHEKQAEGHAAGSTAISPPPDGGSKAWMQAVFLHIVCFNTWGVNNSFGVFQQYYAAELLSSQSQSTISWIGSVQVFCLFVIGTFSGRATDMGYFRITFIIGVFFQLLGTLMASLGSSYYQIFLSQGVCVGIGNGLVLVPSMAVTSTYFSTKRAIAISIGSSGAATGGLVFPVLTERLIAAQGAGYGWAMRCIGFLPASLDLRLAPGIVAAKCSGVLNLLIPLTALASLLAFLWSQVQSQIGLYIFAVFYGFVAHSVQALSFAFLGSLTTDPQKLATRAGMVTSLTSVALLTGPSISGTLIQHTNGSYFPAQVFTGISMLLSALFFTALIVARVGTNVRIKV